MRVSSYRRGLNEDVIPKRLNRKDIKNINFFIILVHFQYEIYKFICFVSKYTLFIITSIFILTINKFSKK